MTKIENRNETSKEFVQESIDELFPQDKVETILVNENSQENLDEKENVPAPEDEQLIYQKKKLDEIELSVSKQKGRKSQIINVLFFIVNLMVVLGILFYQLMKEELAPLNNLKVDVGSLFVLMLLLSVVIFFETSAISYLLKQSTGKWKFGTAYKVAELGRYYDSVTPMATGGQTFQIAYLKSHGTPIHTSLSIPLAKYVFGQIAWMITSLVCLIISWTNRSYGTFVSVTSILGFVLGFVVLSVVIFLSVCKTVGRKLVVRSLKILQKFKIVKNYDKQYEKITKYISDFQDVMKQYARSPKDFLIMLFICLARNIVNYSMPFFIIKFFMPSLAGSMYIKLFVMTCLVDLSASFFPLPGGTGMNELTFSTAFAAVVAVPSYLAWVLIFWRAVTYYFYLLQGVCILSYDFAYGNRKYKWEVTRENLAQESEIFKQEQINKFRADRAKRRKSKNKLNAKEYL